MQERHENRRRYFDELAFTSRKYYLPYLKKFVPALGNTRCPDIRVLEVGCGEGGNLVPFAELGCRVTGVDMAADKIDQARCFFAERGLVGEFIASDIFLLEDLRCTFDIIVLHDVIEHLPDKEKFLCDIKRYLKPEGVLFVGFPAWQMPFGGHQQMARNRIAARLPFYHLLPKRLYVGLLHAFGEEEGTIRGLLDIRETRTTVEMFLRLVRQAGYRIVDRHFWFINPHYQVKFGLQPRTLWKPVALIPWIRNFFTTSSFWLLKK